MDWTTPLYCSTCNSRDFHIILTCYGMSLHCMDCKDWSPLNLDELTRAKLRALYPYTDKTMADMVEDDPCPGS